MRQTSLNRQYQLRKAQMKKIRLSTRRSRSLDEGLIAPLARNRVLHIGRGADFEGRRRRIVDDPD